MATKKQELKLASYLRKLYGSRALMDDLTFPEKIVSRVKALYPGTNPEEILRVMQEQHAKLTEELDQEQTTLPLRRVGEYEKAEARPFSIRDDTRLALHQEFIGLRLDQLTTSCPDLTIGQVKASGFKSYYWAQQGENSSVQVMIFWPYGQYPSQLPSSTFSGDWSGETGAWFVGWLRVKPKKWWFDPYDMVAHAGVFQFTLPAPRCDSIVYWGTKGRVIAVDWSVTADPGWADTDWLLHESPEGAGFPAGISTYSFFPDGAFKNDRGDSTTYDTEVWNRSFRVQAGVQSRIYLGLSVMFFGRNGKIEVPGLQSYFNFDYGITYFMVPEV